MKMTMTQTAQPLPLLLTQLRQLPPLVMVMMMKMLTQLQPLIALPRVQQMIKKMMKMTM